jgi:hypothetical protein
VPIADGTLVATPDMLADDLIPSLLAASDGRRDGRQVVVTPGETCQSPSASGGRFERPGSRGPRENRENRPLRSSQGRKSNDIHG